MRESHTEYSNMPNVVTVRRYLGSQRKCAAVCRSLNTLTEILFSTLFPLINIESMSPKLLYLRYLPFLDVNVVHDFTIKM